MPKVKMTLVIKLLLIFVLSLSAYSSKKMNPHPSFKIMEFLTQPYKKSDGEFKGRILIEIQDGKKYINFYFMNSRNKIHRKTFTRELPLLSYNFENQPRKSNIFAPDGRAYWMFLNVRSLNIFSSDLDSTSFSQVTQLRDRKSEIKLTANRNQTLGSHQVEDLILTVQKPEGSTRTSEKKAFSPKSRKMESPKHGKRVNQKGINVSFLGDSEEAIFHLREISLNHYVLSFSNPISPLEAFFLTLSAL